MRTCARRTGAAHRSPAESSQWHPRLGWSSSLLPFRDHENAASGGDTVRERPGVSSTQTPLDFVVVIRSAGFDHYVIGTSRKSAPFPLCGKKPAENSPLDEIGFAIRAYGGVRGHGDGPRR